MSRKEFGMSRTWFSSVEVAKLFNVSAQTVRRWAEDGSMLKKSYRIHAHGRWRHDQDEVNKILAKTNRYKPRIIF